MPYLHTLIEYGILGFLLLMSVVTLALKATVLGLLVAISQHAPPIRLPVAMDLNILPTAGPPDAGPSKVAPGVPLALQPQLSVE